LQNLISGDHDLSALADLDAADLIDTLSLGVLVLDQELCAIYANFTAEHLLACHLTQMRGRPLAEIVSQPGRFACALKRALGNLEAVVDRDIPIASAEAFHARGSSIDLRVSPLRVQMSRTHLLLELSIHRAR
jgi:nitrogen-specific signal transduction histidine kinase